MPLFQYHNPPADTPELEDGDPFFRVMVSRSRSKPLEPGTAELLKNIRTDRNEAVVRKGLRKLTDDLTFLTPLIIPFQLSAGPLTSGQSFASYATGVFSDPNNDNLDWIVQASTEKAYFWNETLGTLAIPYAGYETVEDEDHAMVVQAAGKVFIYRGWEGDSTSVVSITRSGSTATITTLNPHLLFNGFKIRISGAVQTEYNGDFVVAVTGAKTATFTVSGAPASPATGAVHMRKLKPPLVWDGDFSSAFTPVVQNVLSGGASDMPNADYGLYISNRMIQPYSRDQFIASDILDVQRFDLINNQVDVNIGSADYSVGAHPYQKGSALLFMRKSIHILAGLDAVAFSSGALVEVTREVGCCARRTIQTAGDQIFWLSDNGVYSLRIGQELNLVGRGFPLSEPISDYFDRVNTMVVDASCAVYHNNRYYIAVPLDGSTRNNHVFIYNTLNQGWESVDTFPAAMFVDDLVVSSYGNHRRVFATNREGAIYLFEDTAADQSGTVASPTNNQIDGQVWTRGYRLDDGGGMKRFSKFVVNGEAQYAADAITISAAARNPDSVTQVRTYTAAAADDFTQRGRVGGKRGVSLSLRIVATAGRPVIRSTSVTGVMHDLSARSA